MNLKGRTVLITGGSSGIGFEAGVAIARQGARVILAARDPEKLRQAVGSAKTRSGSTEISSMVCDFASLASIRSFAAEVLARRDDLAVLVNNVGSVSATRVLTVDGFEQTFAVNHLSHFLLTQLLLDRLIECAPARIVTVASRIHRNGVIDFDDLRMDRGYLTIRAYARSKLANVLFTRELARRLDPAKVTATCLHPGAVATNIWSRAPKWIQPALAVAKLFMRSPEQGGAAVVYLAASDEVAGQTGGYFENDKLTAPGKQAEDAALAEKLWRVSESLTAPVQHGRMPEERERPQADAR